MRRRASCFTLLVLLAGASAQAVPVPCPGATTLDVLMSLLDGCFVQDKLFTNFAYSLGAVDAALVNATAVYAVVPGQDAHGWTFAHQGSWTSGFTLSYTVSVDPPGPGLAITASKDQIDTGLIPDGTSVTDTQTAATLTLSGSTAANQGAQAIYAGVTSLTTTSVVTIPQGSLLLSYSQLFYENTSDLSITKTDGVSTAPIGGSTVYTIVVSNAGPTDVVAALVTDNLPAAITSAGWTCTASAGSSCALSGSGSINDTIDLLAGGTATYVLSASISDAATGSLLNVASVSGPAGSTDSDPTNNSASDLDALAPPIPGLSGPGLVLLAMLVAAAAILRLQRGAG
jgi:uncharacterized repeat protein (TIGR01451 family)